MNEPEDMMREQRIEAISSILHALGDDNLDQAHAQIDNLIELTGLSPDHPDILVFRVLLYIQRGQAIDALHYLNELDEQHCPDLRVMCMYFLGDPFWEGLATELAENDPRPHVRESMALLLNRQPDLAMSGMSGALA
ncbi:hypothetical protein FAZ69_16700 [Trinickia terrae]|uniref:Tetratricopeptide repeat protein n=1 Tax=Trinickia terrae TaxID=2571161 RepID=A0A4U1I3T0_9BURK|nr:HrpB1 family type III secretion system apparatus protein [Trinickia terrae]TKC87904.1 hypothetical protein FAZ69_16700 [Trinickia terrae]